MLGGEVIWNFMQICFDADVSVDQHPVSFRAKELTIFSKRSSIEVNLTIDISFIAIDVLTFQAICAMSAALSPSQLILSHVTFCSHF
jgi:hypothetical protein